MTVSDVSKANFAKAQRVLRELDAEFGSEEGYERAVLEDLAKRETIICKQCSFENKIRSKAERKQRCCKCKKQISLTAKTFYHKTHKFRPRVVIQTILEKGIVICPNQAAKLLSVSSDTTSRIYKQLAIVVSKRISKRAMNVPTLFCTSIVCRRSRETPRREHPVAEEIELQREQMKKLSPLPTGFDLTEQQKQVLQLISHDPIAFEQLSNQSLQDAAELTSHLMYLELHGMVQSCPGNKFKLSSSHNLTGILIDPGQVARAESRAQSFAYFIKDFFQGVSRKYLQIYASIHWVSVDRRSFPIGSLRKLCASHPHIPYEEILAFVTPLTVRLVPDFNTS